MEKPTEIFKECSLDGDMLIMEFYGEVGSVRKVTIGSRFDNFVVIYPTRAACYQSMIEACFKFFRNIAILHEQAEIAGAWKEYKANQLN